MKSVRKRAAWILFGVPAMLFGSACVPIILQLRQSDLDHDLIQAAKVNSTEWSLVLLDEGANPNVRDSGAAPSFRQILRNLLHWQKPAPQPKGPTALMYAVNFDNSPLARALLAHKAAGVNDVIEMGKELPWSDRNTLLLEAANKGNIALADTLLDYGADINARNRWGDGLLLAAFPEQEFSSRPDENRIRFVKRMIQRGANIHARGGDGRNLLDVAAHYEIRDMVDYLLEHGADPNSEVSYRGALCCAVNHDDLHMAVALMNRGARVNPTVNKSIPPLAEAESFRMMRLLVARGADLHASIDIGDHSCGSILHYAAACDNVKLVRFLLSRGQNINETTTRGETALKIGALCRCSKSVSLLIREGANVNLQDHDGQTALINSVMADSRDDAIALLSNGADAAITDRYGDSALDLAFHDKNAAMIALLKKWGARRSKSKR